MFFALESGSMRSEGADLGEAKAPETWYLMFMAHIGLVVTTASLIAELPTGSGS